MQLQNGRWLCPNNCGRTYKEKFSLSRHRRQECGVDPQHRCLLCSKIFKRKESLKSHSFLVHKVMYMSATDNQRKFQNLEVPFTMCKNIL